MKVKYIVVLVLLIAVQLPAISGYSMEPPNKVTHQHITKEASIIWKNTPYEIMSHSSRDIDTEPIDWPYEEGDDIIVGSAEQDLGPEWLPMLRHFWQPDIIDGPSLSPGQYNYGLELPVPFYGGVPIWIAYESSYRRGLNYLREYAIPLYLQGNTEESYYFLGHIAHFLEDATVPAHMHLDCHAGKVHRNVFTRECGSDGDNGADDSTYEEYTAAHFSDYSNASYTNDHYLYEKLPNIEDLNWSRVLPTEHPLDLYPDFFKLFWYTAQKTQYYASDDSDGNRHYWDIDSGALRNFSDDGINLWAGEGVTIVENSSQLVDDDVNNTGEDITNVADALVPHAMKAVAGLYRLFWHTVNSYHWPTFHHDNQRTGVVILKGDVESASDVDDTSIVLDTGVTSDYVARIVIGDVDRDGRMESIVAAKKSGSTDSVLFSVEEQGDGTLSEQWNYTIAAKIMGAPSIGNLDGDDRLEIVVGLKNGTIMRIDVDSSNVPSKFSSFTVGLRYSTLAAGWYRAELGYSLIEDMDLDGSPEVVFAEAQPTLYDWPARVYVLDANLTNITHTTLDDELGGGFGAISSSDFYGDDNIEIAVPGYYRSEAFEFDNGQLFQLWSIASGRTEGAPVIYDYDFDGYDEVIFNSWIKICAPTQTCHNRTHIISTQTLQTEDTLNYPDFLPTVTPSIINLDNDSNSEIVFTARYSTSAEDGAMIAYDLETETKEWEFNNNSNLNTTLVSPSVADIDGDGNYNIIFPSNDEQTIYVLDNEGNKTFTYSFSGAIGSAVALGDLDGDDAIEMSIKHAGSPDTILSILSGVNNKPDLAIGQVNVSVGENQTVNLSFLANISATDPDNDSLNFTYSSPFNESGLFFANCFHADNYTIFVEVSDGSLSDIGIVNLQINDTCNELDISDFAVIAEVGRFRITEFNISNFYNDTSVGVNWTYDTGDNTVFESNQTFNITVEEDVLVLIAHIYSEDDIYQAAISATDGVYSDFELPNVRVNPLSTDGLGLLDSSAVIEFSVYNNDNVSMSSVNWTFDTNDSILVSALHNSSLAADESLVVLFAHNYSSSGDYQVNATGRSDELNEEQVINITI